MEKQEHPDGNMIVRPKQHSIRASELAVIALTVAMLVAAILVRGWL